MKAVDAMLTLAKGGIKEAQRRAGSVRFTYLEQDGFTFGDKHLWLHWSLLWGSVLEEAEQWEEAARHYETVLAKVINDSERSAGLLLTVARIQLKGGQDAAALQKLLRFDILPIGGANQRAEARVLSARIMLDQSEKLSGQEQEDRLRAISTMLGAVALRDDLTTEIRDQALVQIERLPEALRPTAPGEAAETAAAPTPAAEDGQDAAGADQGGEEDPFAEAFKALDNAGK
jgi:hypothetical protein